jgi:hypothetical protein
MLTLHFRQHSSVYNEGKCKEGHSGTIGLDYKKLDDRMKLLADPALLKQLPQYPLRKFPEHREIRVREILYGAAPAEKVNRLATRDSNAAKAPHIVDIFTVENYAGRYTSTYYVEMITGTCVDLSSFPVEWTSLKTSPQNLLYHCTFFDLPRCGDGARSFTVEGGFESPNLRKVKDNWYHNIRSLKCQPGRSKKATHRSSGLDELVVAEKHQPGQDVFDSNIAEKHQIGVNLDEAAIPKKQKHQVDGGALTARAYHLVDIFSEPNYFGQFLWVQYYQMLAGHCIDLSSSDWASLRIYPQDTVYNCVFFDQRECEDGSTKGIKFQGGKKGYDIADLQEFQGGVWYRTIQSVRCQVGK